MSKVKYAVKGHVQDSGAIVWCIYENDGEPGKLLVASFHTPEEAQAMLRGLLRNRGEVPAIADAMATALIRVAYKEARHEWREHYLARTRSNGHKETTCHQ